MGPASSGNCSERSAFTSAIRFAAREVVSDVNS
jgi:hypothetical protein